MYTLWNVAADFNSHAHVERDRFGGYHRRVRFISTHTLTWSVTRSDRTYSVGRSDFNSHAHVERDVRVTVGKEIIDNFNSHAHVERDTGVKKAVGTYKNFNSHAHVERDFKPEEDITVIGISTHTLTWSVTQGRNLWDEVWDFNSHAHVERDRTNIVKQSDIKNFNSHAHVERDNSPCVQ